jgi:hypothetical protein
VRVPTSYPHTINACWFLFLLFAYLLVAEAASFDKKELCRSDTTRIFFADALYMWRKTTAAGDPQHKVLTLLTYYSVTPSLSFWGPSTPASSESGTCTTCTCSRRSCVFSPPERASGQCNVWKLSSCGEQKIREPDVKKSASSFSN